MAEIVDFAKYSSTDEALTVWLEPCLHLRIGINMPSNPPPSPPPLVPNPYQELQPQQQLQQQQEEEDQQPQISPSPQSPLIPTPQVHDDEAILPMPMPMPMPKLEFPFGQSSSQDYPTLPAVHRPTARARRNPNQGPADGKRETIDPPFPWATNRRATVHSLDYLIANGIASIKGEVQCRRCERRELMTFDLRSKFREVEGFVRDRLDTMHERAPAEWMNPVFAECSACAQPNCMRPVLGEQKRNYNWLFLFLGQSLGICTLKELKWFCKHTQNHRTGAKDRVLYLSYIAIGKQLDPNGVFRGASEYH